MKLKIMCLDFDDTILHYDEDRTQKYIEDCIHEFMHRLITKGYLICICSRSPVFHVERYLNKYGLRNFVLKIAGDKRPKNIQIRHILSELSEMFHPYPSDRLEEFVVSQLVNSPANDAPECIALLR